MPSATIPTTVATKMRKPRQKARPHLVGIHHYAIEGHDVDATFRKHFLTIVIVLDAPHGRPLSFVHREAVGYTGSRQGIYYHLRYHLWARVHEDLGGSNDVVPERKARRQGPNGTRWESTEARNGSLRIRRSQVRVLPSIPDSSARTFTLPPTSRQQRVSSKSAVETKPWQTLGNA
jgi:hypothetical protein